MADSAVAPFEHCTAAEAAEDASDADEAVSQDPHSLKSMPTAAVTGEGASGAYTASDTLSARSLARLVFCSVPGVLQCA